MPTHACYHGKVSAPVQKIASIHASAHTYTLLRRHTLRYTPTLPLSDVRKTPVFFIVAMRDVLTPRARAFSSSSCMCLITVSRMSCFDTYAFHAWSWFHRVSAELP